MNLAHLARGGAVAAAALIALAPSAVPAATPNPSGPAVRHPATSDSLRTLAARAGLRIGTAVNVDALAQDAGYRAIAAEQFNSVTPENVMKWDAVEPSRGTYTWAAADGLVDFARANKQKVRGHTLVWHSQLPAWLTSGTWTEAELRQILKTHVTDQVRHFRGRIWAWDVVNEAFNEDGTLRDTLWLRTLGPGYLADAFRWAHAADPHATLFYNDYNIEGFGPKSDAVYALVRQLRAEGVPIEGVGVQTHLDTQYPFPDRMRANLQRFADLGVDVAVTEADVRIPLPVDPTKQLAQNADYAQSLQACLLVSRCVSYTVWGFGDAYSWVPAVFAGEGAADIYDEQLQPKPSYDALHDTLELATR
jgi:endo-1,4-beta-xylanase